MDEMRPADPVLYRFDDEGQPLLRAKCCGNCGSTFFPPQSYGCEVCGSDDSLEDHEIPGGGVVAASAVVHASISGAEPFAVAEILLDAGPTVRGLLETPRGPEPGTRVVAVAVPSPGEEACHELRFTPAGSASSGGARSGPPPVSRARPRSAGGAPLAQRRPVFVVGVGLHRYQRPSDSTYVELGLTAVRAALADAGMDWSEVDSAFTATVNVGFAAGRTMLRYLGATGIRMAQVENASASGSTAFRLACEEVASGTAEVSLAVGVDKAAVPNMAITKTGVHDLVAGRMLPVTHFALLADAYLRRWDLDPEVLGLVAVKNHRNGAANPFAQRQKERSLEDVMGEQPLAGALTRLQCCPIGEGAAAALVVSEDALGRLGLDSARAIGVRASVARSERVYEPGANWDTELTAETAEQLLGEAGVDPSDLDVVEMHDAFTIEELLYLEAMGLCAPGEAGNLLEQGAWGIGGRCAVSPSGGLLSMGHPLGPTGVGQIAEIAQQLRGEAGDRQQPGARLGLAHMVGVGAVCVMHLLEGPG